MSGDELVHEAEQHVLSAALQDPAALALVRQSIEPSDLSIDLHRELLQAMIALADEGVRPDLLTVTQRLHKKVELIGGPSAIVTTFSRTGVSANVPSWLGMVRSSARIRARVKLGRNIQMTDDEHEHNVLDEGMRHLSRLNGGSAARRRFRTALELAASQSNPIPSLLSEALLPRGQVTMVHGKGGLGKTYVLMGLAMAIASGREWLTLPTTQGRVAIVTYEVPEEVARMFIREWAAYDGIEPPEDIEICTAEDAGGPLFNEGPQALEAMIREKRADVLMVDPFRSAHTKDENDNSSMSALMDMLRQVAAETGCCIHLSHHDRKSRPGEVGDDSDSGRGSSAIRDAVRASWRLSKAKGQLCLEFEKVSFGTPPDPIWLKKRNHQPPEVTAAPEEGAKAGRKNRIQKVRELLRATPDGMTAAEIADVMETKTRTVHDYLSKIPEARNLCHTGQEGRYVIDQPLRDS